MAASKTLAFLAVSLPLLWLTLVPQASHTALAAKGFIVGLLIAAALLAGVVFAAVVNIALAARRPTPAPSPAPVGFRPPSPNELGPGVGVEGADGEEPEEQPAETARP
jgi:hypothetical protein